MPEQHYDPLPSSIKAARRFAREVLADLPDDVSYRATVVVSELVTNAVLHARTPFTLLVDVGPDRDVVRIEVTDGSARLPRTPIVPLDAAVGRGLAVVSALCRRWGTHGADEGKTVWADLPVARRVDVPGSVAGS